MKAISFTGLARSGKDTAADYLVEKYGFTKLVMSDILAKELKKQGIDDTKMNRSHMGKSFRKEFGDDVVARRVFEKANAVGAKKVIFVGPRSVSEINFFKSKIDGFVLVALEAPSDSRFERRSEADGQTREKFLQRDKHDTSNFELNKVIAMANHTIANKSTIDDLKKAIDGLMRKV